MTWSGDGFFLTVPLLHIEGNFLKVFTKLQDGDDVQIKENIFFRGSLVFKKRLETLDSAFPEKICWFQPFQLLRGVFRETRKKSKTIGCHLVFLPLRAGKQFFPCADQIFP